MYIEHTWKQLKKSLDWYQEQCRLVDYDGDKILREIELQRIQGNELSPFKKQALVFIAQNKKTPIEKLDLEKDLFPILIYEKLNKKISYILSVDPAEGLARNNNAFVLINPHTQMIAAEYKSPYISPPNFFRMICKFMKQRCPRSMVVIENNRGRELINRFLESEYRYRLWYDSEKLTAKAVQTTDKYGSEKRSAYQRRSLGFETNRSSKPLLFSIIERFMEEELEKVNTEYLVKDVASVQRKPNGAIIMGAGDDDEGEGHGDVLMSYLIGIYVLYNAKNLEEFGIFPGSSEPENEDKELTIAEKKSKIQDILPSLPDNLQELFRDVLQQTDPVQASYDYEKQLQLEIQKQQDQFDMNYRPNTIDDFYVNPEAQDAYWQVTEQTIANGRAMQESDPSRQFNIEDYTNW